MSEGSQVSRRRARVLRRAAAFLAGSVLAVGCAAAPPTGEPGEDDRGPLRVSAGVGGNAVFAPRQMPWSVSFGYFMLCSRDPSAEVIVDDVRYRASVEPVSVRILHRRVDAEDIVLRGGDVPTRFQPFYSVRGAAPDFDEPYADPAPAGRYRDRVSGVRVTQPCDEVKKRVHGFSELVFVLEAGRSGAQIDEFDIHYRADGKRHEVRVPWEMTACGTDVPQQELCTPP